MSVWFCICYFFLLFIDTIHRSRYLSVNAHALRPIKLSHVHFAFHRMQYISIDDESHPPAAYFFRACKICAFGTPMAYLFVVTAPYGLGIHMPEVWDEGGTVLKKRVTGSYWVASPTRNKAPEVLVLAISTNPLWACAKRLTRARPRPVPVLWRVDSSSQR